MAVIFSCGVSGLSTVHPTRRFASSAVHRGLPSGGALTAANRSSASSIRARMRWIVNDTPV